MALSVKALILSAVRKPTAWGWILIIPVPTVASDPARQCLDARNIMCVLARALLDRRRDVMGQTYTYSRAFQIVWKSINTKTCLTEHSILSVQGRFKKQKSTALTGCSFYWTYDSKFHSKHFSTVISKILSPEGHHLLWRKIFHFERSEHSLLLGITIQMLCNHWGGLNPTDVFS